MARVRRLVLDVLKPHDPDALAFADAAADHDGVSGVNVALMETDREVQNVKMTVEGESVPAEAVHDAVEDLGGTVHSVDEVVCGEAVVEQSETPQD